MSRYVEITKDGNSYRVNPNASGSGDVIIYGWVREGGGNVAYTTTETPVVNDVMFFFSEGNPEKYHITGVSDNTIMSDEMGWEFVGIRDSTTDINLSSMD